MDVVRAIGRAPRGSDRASLDGLARVDQATFADAARGIRSCKRHLLLAGRIPTPLDTGQGQVEPQKGQPEFSRQAILSVPPEPDNQSQTIVVPPDIKLAQDVPLPNVVSWPQTLQSVPISATSPGSTLPIFPTSVVAPPPEVNPSSARRTLAGLSENIIAPAPDASGIANSREIRAPQAAVVAPAPAVDSANTRQYGDINIGHSEVVAPAPALPVSEQRAATGRMAGGWGMVPLVWFHRRPQCPGTAQALRVRG